MNLYKSVILILPTIFLLSCKKYLDKIPDKKLNVPTTLNDFQNLLDNEIMIDRNSAVLGDFASDDVYFNFSTWQAAYSVAKNAYVWATDVYEGQSILDWNRPYQQIYYGNVVLDDIQRIKITSENMLQYNSIIGSAYFYRALAFYNLEETFGQPYKDATANQDLGIPLRLSSDLNAISTRATVGETFRQIISDLEKAKSLLPVSVQLNNRNRPSKPAVFGLLARIYLSMQNYPKALECADSSLVYYKTIIDYNTVNVSASFPFSNPQSDEITVQSSLVYYNFPRIPVDTNLYKSYDNNDLRKLAFFRNNPTSGILEFKGSYSTTSYQFSGLTTAEMYLIKAECLARKNDKDSALNTLNTLMFKRWKNNGTWAPITAATTDEALSKILTERRKELVFRGLRWSDLRRLNQESKFAKTISRDLNGQIYQLTPNSIRYTFPIPDDEIRLSGIQQNMR